MKKKHRVLSLKEFWEQLGDNVRTRAKAMSKICTAAGVSYQHTKSVINRKRSFSIDSALLMQAEIEKLGVHVEITDFILPSSERR